MPASLDTVRDITKAQAQLEASTRLAEDALIRSFRQAQLRAWTRVSELLATAPSFTATDLQKRLAWYFQNIPSLEIAEGQAGYLKGVKSYLDAYPRVGEFAERILRAGRIPKDLTSIPKELIAALQKRDVGFFSELNSQALQRLDQTLLDSVVVGRTPTGTLAELKGVITGSYPWKNTRGLYEWHAGTYARTAQMRFSRQILKAKADELDLKHFLYVGPIDAKKRKFCLRIVGQAFRRDQIEEMENGQTGDVFSEGGGYNCRDTWSPIDAQLFNELQKAGDDAPPPKPTPKQAIKKTMKKVQKTPKEKPAELGGIPDKAPPGWRPAKTMKAATDYATKNNLASNVDFGKLSLEAANAINRRVHATLLRFPKLRDGIDFLGSPQGRYRYLKNRLFPSMRRYVESQVKLGYMKAVNPKDIDAIARKHVTKALKHQKASGEVAARYPGMKVNSDWVKKYGNGEITADEMGRGLAFNEKYLSGKKITRYLTHEELEALKEKTGKTVFSKTEESTSYREYLRIRKSQVKLKFHPEGTEAVESLIDHELGHALDWTVGSHTSHGLSTRAELRALWNSRAFKDMADDLSEYAYKKYPWAPQDPIEMIAEAWSEYLNSPTPRELATKVGEALIAALGG